MEKTKLGVKVCLLGALGYWLSMFGGFIPAMLLCGYVLLLENDKWLKKTTLNALMLSVFFGVISGIISVFPDIVGFINSFFGIFSGHFYADGFNSFINLLLHVVSIAETIMFIVLGFVSLRQKDITVPFVSKFVDKYFEEKENNCCHKEVEAVEEEVKTE
ncbi:MAG: hypothetical protein IJZ57_11210 [Clostridia bacterium]|nr:hypothetical protein [Clostridia bacterium]